MVLTKQGTWCELMMDTRQAWPGSELPGADASAAVHDSSTAEPDPALCCYCSCHRCDCRAKQVASAATLCHIVCKLSSVNLEAKRRRRRIGKLLFSKHGHNVLHAPCTVYIWHITAHLLPPRL